jgi:predicted transcriptional regulator
MTVHLTLTLDEAVAARLDEIAAKTDRSRERVAQDMLGAFVEIEASHVDAIKAGLEAARRGEFASDEEVSAVLGRARGEAWDDGQLEALSRLLSEWEAPEDGKAFDDL